MLKLYVDIVSLMDAANAFLVSRIFSKSHEILTGFWVTSLSQTDAAEGRNSRTCWLRRTARITKGQGAIVKTVARPYLSLEFPSRSTRSTQSPYTFMGNIPDPCIH